MVITVKHLTTDEFDAFDGFVMGFKGGLQEFGGLWWSPCSINMWFGQ